jgi:hypothetical protein
MAGLKIVAMSSPWWLRARKLLPQFRSLESVACVSLPVMDEKKQRQKGRLVDIDEQDMYKRQLRSTFWGTGKELDSLVVMLVGIEV